MESRAKYAYRAVVSTRSGPVTRRSRERRRTSLSGQGTAGLCGVARGEAASEGACAMGVPYAFPVDDTQLREGPIILASPRRSTTSSGAALDRWIICGGSPPHGKERGRTETLNGSAPPGYGEPAQNSNPIRTPAKVSVRPKPSRTAVTPTPTDALESAARRTIILALSKLRRSRPPSARSR